MDRQHLRDAVLDRQEVSLDQRQGSQQAVRSPRRSRLCRITNVEEKMSKKCSKQNEKVKINRYFCVKKMSYEVKANRKKTVM